MNPLQLCQSLECPVCFHVRSGAVYICKMGHSVCGHCYTKLSAAPAKRCPMARCGYVNPPLRNLAVEQIIAGGGVARDCDNADHGCQKTGVGEGMEEHKQECLHREVPCLKTNCQVKIRLSELNSHFAASGHTVWPVENIDINRYRINFNVRKESRINDNLDWSLGIKETKDGTFYVQLVKRGGTYYAWVVVVGGVKEAAKWSCDLSVGGLAYRGLQVHPIDNTVEDILESGQFFAIARQQARQLDKPWGKGGITLCVDYNIVKK